MRNIVLLGEPDEGGLIQQLHNRLQEVTGENIKLRCYSGVQYKQAEVLQDLPTARPDFIICLGTAPLSTIVSGVNRETPMKTLRENLTMEWRGIPVRCTYSTKWAQGQGGINSGAYSTILLDCETAIKSGNETKRFEYELFAPHQAREFLAKFADADVLGYDTEGSSLEPAVEGFQLGGVGLARKGYAAYLCFKDFGDLNYNLPADVAALVGRFLKAKNNNSTLLAFNLKYEVPVTRVHLGQYLDRIVDVMQECRTLDVRGGLKEISKQKLRIAGWTKDLEDWKETMTALLGHLRPISTGARPEMKPFVEGGLAATIAFLEKKHIACYTKACKSRGLEVVQDSETGGYRAVYAHEGVETTSDLMEFSMLVDHLASTAKAWEIKVELNSRVDKILELIAIAVTMCQRYYGDSSIDRLTSFIRYKMERADYECNYTEIPKEIVGYYCGADCHNTLELHEIIQGELRAAGLTKAAEYYNKQIYLGQAMEMNGIIWDDAVAEQKHQQHVTVMLDALKQFLSCNRTRTALPIDFDTPEGETRQMNGQDLINIMSAVSVDKLKEYFNPDSTHPSNTIKLGGLLITPTVRVCLMLQEINNAFTSNADDCRKTWPILTTLMLHAFKTRAGGVETIKEFLRRFRMVKEAGRLNGAEEVLFARYAGYKLPSAESEVIQLIMDSLINFTGFNFDDKDTWVEDAKPVYYYKLFKKVSKVLSSFINGVAGRKSVYVTRENPDTGYYERLRGHDGEPLAEGEVHMFAPSYGVNVAKTKRWTSAYHGIPTMSESKQAYRSRFKNGIMFKCDFSQHELRIISSVCGDENMIQAFVENKDLHKLVATKLYNKAEEDVTDNERAVAKAANFGLVYLKTVETFALEYMGGDVESAARVFRAIFDTFPKLEIWRNRCIADLHAAVKASPGAFVRYPIYTLWGDPIWHEFNREKKMEMIDAERYSVNWIIQSTASNLAALALAEAQSFLTINDYKTKAFGFTHDCEEFDTHPDEFFLMLTKIPEISEQYLFREFNLPVKIDVELGTNLGALVEFKRAKGATEFMTGPTSAAGVFDGVAADVDDIIANLRAGGYTVTEGEATGKKKRISGKDLFSIKGCWHSGIGQEIEYKSVPVQITREGVAA